MSRIPGPFDQLNQPIAIDKGTLCVQRSCPPDTRGLRAVPASSPARWTDKTITEYRTMIVSDALRLAQTNEEFDCADWAFTMLIRFARDHRLPLKFHKVGSGAVGGAWQKFTERDNIAVAPLDFDPRYTDYYVTPEVLYSILESTIRSQLGARDLILTGFDNAVDVVGIAALLPGDIVALSAGEHRHIQLVLKNDVEIQVWDDAKKTGVPATVLDILQGDMPASIIRRAAWDLNNGLYYRYDFSTGRWHIESNTPGDIRRLWHVTVFGRRWNFPRFNEALP